ncbi:glycosyltransferase family 4 protein [Saccharicrinis sp. GN24d3]|uniref:glycosyltransferase family 4 protein n=1 Tax=Saccharicrinis sp. GN24d3 TaxID=3458416 RepID=UPI004036FA38
MNMSPNKKRLRIGVLFDFQHTWMGGITYIINVIRTFGFLPDKEKPEIVLFYSTALEKHIHEFKYPYIELVERNPPPLVKGFFQSWVKRKNIFIDDIVSDYSLDAVYPNRNYPVKSKSGAKVVAWYADLQHKYYPEFFTRETLVHRAIRLHFMLRNTDDLVVSSQAVLDDFKKFFRIRPKLKLHVFHFTSINDIFQDVSIESLREKYNLPEKYFMVSNQFHKHKNHKVLLLALTKLNGMGVKKYMAMTGSFPVASNSPYIAELHQIIEEHKLSGQINFLGLIPRKDQLQLMKHSQAVIQPSLFEGWSTVIEDAISIQVPVIASDLAVNKEQLKETGIYFDPNNVDQLTSILSSYPDRDFNIQPYGNYNERIVESAKALIGVFNKKE